MDSKPSDRLYSQNRQVENGDYVLHSRAGGFKLSCRGVDEPNPVITVKQLFFAQKQNFKFMGNEAGNEGGVS